MTPTARVLVVALSGVLAASLAWVVLRREQHDPDLELVDKRVELDRLLAERGGAGSSVDLGRPFALVAVDEPTANKLFVMNNPNFRFDPDCYYQFVPRVDESFEWPEHPGGSWRRVTNDAGLREDDDRTLREGDVRVLVTGDSHTEGACNNPESFANRLETRLAQRHGGRTANVLNAGAVGYSFYNYLGAVRKYLADEPQVVVVAVYGGNDFVETLAPHHWFRGSQLPPRRVDYWDRIDRAIRVSNKALAQGLNQVLYFQEHPDQVDLALEAALVTAGEIKRLCDQHGTRLVYVYVPPAFEAGWAELDELRARAMDELDLTAADLEVARRMADRFFAGLGELEIPFLDMGPRYRAAGTPSYWKRDLHIDLAGHERIAAALDAWIAGEIGGDGAQTAGARPRAPGPFSEVADNGRVILAGAWDEQGRRTGTWQRHYLNGALRSSGEYVSGRRSGEWRWWFDDRSPKKSGSFVDGFQDGPWVEYHRGGGKKNERSWRMGQPDGRWIELDEVGSLVTEGGYAAGERDGEWRIYHAGEHAGKLDRLATFRAGALDGPFEKWDTGGVQLWDGAHSDGKRHGAWVLRWPSGEKMEEGRFDLGQRVGRWSFWDEAGGLDAGRSGLYEAGERTGDE